MLTGYNKTAPIINKKFILDVVNKTTAYKGKKLLRNEIEGLVQYIKEVDFNQMGHTHSDDIIDKIAENFAKQLGVRTGSIIDTHEVMKRHIGSIKHDGTQSLYMDTECSPYHATYGISDPSVLGVTGDTGQNTTYNKYDRGRTKEGFGTRARNTEETNNVYSGSDNFKKFNTEDPHTALVSSIPRQKTQTLYLLLDSKYRNLSTDNSTFKWTVLHSANTAQGTVNTIIDQIHNIINVQFDRFSVPYVASADNVYKKTTMLIEEFSSMSVLTNSGRRYHMIFDSDIQGNRINLTPLINDEGRFRFHTPINILDTITLKFQSPFSPIEFLHDRFNVRITSLNSTHSTLTFTVQHNVSDGELVHLEGYNTLAPAIDFAQISTINDEQGHIVTFINNYELRIGVGLETIIDDPTNLTICFIASRRLIIPIRMEYIA
jgi:hypothetical protein